MFTLLNKSQLIPIITFVFVLVSLVIFLSSPGWNGEFWFDDFPNIVSNSAIKIQNLDLNSLLSASAPALAALSNAFAARLDE